MSQPSTPARSITNSNSSTPRAALHGISPQALTPKSKIKAMLAAVDDESDSEIVSQRNQVPRPILSSITGNIQRGYDRNTEPESNEDLRVVEEGDDEEDDEESLSVPRGRLAARLKGQVAVRQDTPPPQEPSGGEDAYARIKRRLLLGKAGDEAVSSVSDRDGSDSSEQGKGIKMAPATPPQISRKIHRKKPPSAPVSPEGSQLSSPGLFVTPEGVSRTMTTSEQQVNVEGSDSELPADPEATKRFLELVARKRAEREAKYMEQDKKKRDDIAKQRKFENELSEDTSSASGMSDEDRAIDRKLTQQSRPTRKASKKALEEMNRETQRMSRNMQLAHQAKTKKKITKDSLFARFNFRTSTASTAETHQNPSSSTVASSAPASDVEETSDNPSPPTSPIVPDDSSMTGPHHYVERNFLETRGSGIEEDQLPSMIDIMNDPLPKLDKGKGRAVEINTTETNPEPSRSKKTLFTQPPIKIRPPKPYKCSESVNLDSESEPEGVTDKKPRSSKRDVFDRVPASKVQDGRSLQTLRALAHLTSPGNSAYGRKATMSLADMQTSLRKRARQQAAQERAAKIEDLKSRGIIVQTAEERQQDQAEVENLLDKARREGEEIMQKEKRAAKKARVANGEIENLPDTSDEDEDYQDEQDENPEVELSGSEEEEEENADDSEGLGDLVSRAEHSAEEEEGEEEGRGILLDLGATEGKGLVDDEASEDGDDEAEENTETDDGEEEDEDFRKPGIQRSRRNKMVVVDYDDDDTMEEENQVPASNVNPVTDVPIFPTGFPNFGVEPMGMTQAFAATMADSQPYTYDNGEEQDSLAMLDKVPEPDFPIFDTNDCLDLVGDSQAGEGESETKKSPDIDLHFLQSQIRYDAFGDTQGQVVAIQMSDIPDPTQDVGFVLSSPAPERFVSEPPSTVATVVLPVAAADGSPVKKKRGRLQRRVLIEKDVSDVEDNSTSTEDQASGTVLPTNAFNAMREARKARKAAAAKKAFDKKKSEAKGMVEEQAQESEDEYAGLGGASDEDSGEEDEDVKAMMDHGEVKVDERRLAQLYANNERASDEKAVEKLYKDINSGMLRKKRGADFDLSDSDDDAEARRKRKQREFAKMRKALLADENIGKIAEDPKKSAFLQSIEDRENDDDFAFLDRPAEDSFRVELETQEEPDSQSQQPAQPDPTSNKRKRPLQDSTPDTANMRPPATARRTAAPKKPATLAEIRESVSFLIEEPGSINIPQEPSSSASEDESSKQNPSHTNPRRTPANPIIDRLSLKRAESTSTSTTSRLAFHDPTASNSSIIGGFKIPSLLRRATTSQLNGNSAADANGISTAAATERAAGGGEKADFVRRGGTKRSSINWVSREKERKGMVEGVERRRREERERVARERRRGGLGGLGVGCFE